MSDDPENPSNDPDEEESEEHVESPLEEVAEETPEPPGELPEETDLAERPDRPDEKSLETRFEPGGATSTEEVTEEAEQTASEQGESDAPLEDLARSLEAGAEPNDESEEALFEEMSVGEVDSESVWQEISGEAEEETGTSTGPEPGGPSAPREDVEAVESQPGEPEEHVVPKRKFCQRCRYFSEPPETACSHEGTEIVEVVDSDHFRVRDCPMVGEEGEREFGG